MKSFLKFLAALIVIAVIAAAAGAGAFYKNATPSLIVDLSKNSGKSESVCASMFSPEIKSEEELSEKSVSLTSSYWTSKWCIDMGENALKSVHFDLTGYDFKSYLKDLISFDFGGFTGIASMSGDKSEINIICKDAEADSKVVLYGFGKTPLAGKTLEIKVEEAVFKGEAGEPVLPVILRDYTAGAGDKLVIKLGDTDKNNIYHIRICEADKTAAPAFENDNVPKKYALDKELSADVNIENDGEYTISCIFKKCEENSYFEIYADSKAQKSAETFKCDKSACVSRNISLKKGTHRIQLVSEEPLPEFEGLIVEPAENTKAVYILDKKDGLYSVYAPEEGEYSLTSTELEGSVSVNSSELNVSEIGSVTAELKKGLNEIKLNSEKSVDLKITRITD